MITAKLFSMSDSRTLSTVTDNTGVFPDFCSAKAVLIALLLAELLAILFALQGYTDSQSFWSTVGMNCFFIIWVMLPSQALLCLLKNRLAQYSPLTGIIVAFCIIQATTLFVTWMSQSGMSYIELDHANQAIWPDFYLRTLGVSCIVSLVLLYHLHMQALWKQQVQSELNARLQALQSRIQPHFLFNSLNTIASTVHDNPGLAENLLVHMSELMRAGLNTQTSLVTLTDELSLVHGYLDIESQRVGERLNVEWNVDQSICDARIPPLSVQPLVENAVYHGIEPRMEGGTVEITAIKRGHSIILMVRNSATTMQKQSEVSQGHGIALENVVARVKGWFGDEAKVVFSTVDGWFQARLIIPYVTT